MFDKRPPISAHHIRQNSTLSSEVVQQIILIGVRYFRIAFNLLVNGMFHPGFLGPFPVMFETFLFNFLGDLTVNVTLQIIRGLVRIFPKVLGQSHHSQSPGVIGDGNVMTKIALILGNVGLLSIRTNGIDGSTGYVLGLDGFGFSFSDVPNLKGTIFTREKYYVWLFK